MSTNGVGMLIRRFRGDRSMRAYGSAIGVSYVAVRAFERGQYLPKLATVGRIAIDAGLSEAERRAFLDMLLAVHA